MTDEIRLNARESMRYGAAVLALQGKISRREAAWRMGLSPRQTQRVLDRVRTEGERGAVYNRKGRSTQDLTPKGLPWVDVFRTLRLQGHELRLGRLASDIGCGKLQLKRALARIRL